MKRLAIVVAAVVILAVMAEARKKQTADLSFLVVRDENGKAVRNASVVLHPVIEGKQGKGGFQLKTDNEGRSSFGGVPYGTLRVQVLAQGFQTYGEDYEINQPAMEITIKMKRPGEQYSIYGDKNQPKKDAGGEPAEKDQKPK